MDFFFQWVRMHGFFRAIFVIFLTSSWDPFFPDFGANLASTCLPTWSQNPPKTVSRGIQIPSQLASYFRCLFVSILGTSWVDFWCDLGLKLEGKLAKKSIMWPLVGKLAEITKNTKFADSSTLLLVFWSLGSPTSKQN